VSPTEADAVSLALRQGIRAERARRHISQTELAKRMGWSRQTASNVETGIRAVLAAELPLLCDSLGCNLSKLLSDAPEAARKKLGLE
jgi:transcriptional regulator with XRE-family HTH domain